MGWSYLDVVPVVDLAGRTDRPCGHRPVNGPGGAVVHRPAALQQVRASDHIKMQPGRCADPFCECALSTGPIEIGGPDGARALQYRARALCQTDVHPPVSHQQGHGCRPLDRADATLTQTPAAWWRQTCAPTAPQASRPACGRRPTLVSCHAAPRSRLMECAPPTCDQTECHTEVPAEDRGNTLLLLGSLSVCRMASR